MTLPARLTLTALPGLPLVRAGDDLAALILKGLAQAEVQLVDGDILVVAQKIVSKSESRMVHLGEVEPGEEACRLAETVEKDPRLVQVILGESRRVIRASQGVLIVEHRMGFICANAGVDHSNVRGEAQAKPEDWVLLLPEDPDGSAQRLRERLESVTGARLGVIINDSHGRAWRMGTVGVAIGVAGFPALMDLRGRPDLFGDRLQITQVGLADEMAAAASILMGQADEGLPVIHARGLPYALAEGVLHQLLRPEEQDLFR